jgi:hypothetical protein
MGRNALRALSRPFKLIVPGAIQSATGTIFLQPGRSSIPIPGPVHRQLDDRNVIPGWATRGIFVARLSDLRCFKVNDQIKGARCA